MPTAILSRYLWSKHENKDQQPYCRSCPNGTCCQPLHVIVLSAKAETGRHIRHSKATATVHERIQAIQKGASRLESDRGVPQRRRYGKYQDVKKARRWRAFFCILMI